MWRSSRRVGALFAVVGLLAALTDAATPASAATVHGATAPAATVQAATTLPPNPGRGYWLVVSDGGIFNFGIAFHGSTGAVHLNQPIIAMASTPNGTGYYLVASDGGIFNFDAPFHGSTGGTHLNQPIIGMAVDPVTGGYWLVAADGGVFNFDAPLYGSLGAVHLNKPIVGIAATPDGGGYYLVASDGGVFNFGDAHFNGSTGGVHLNQQVVGMAVDAATGGYWLVARDGGIFNFDASFDGSTGGVHLNRPIVGMAATPDGAGYYLVATDGGVFNFNVPFYGSTGRVHLNQPVVGLAAPSLLLVACPGAQFSGDAYAPPCIHFGGYNGRDTARGVSDTAITVAFRLTSDDTYGNEYAKLAGAVVHDSNADIEQTVDTLARYFNAHYQLYDRQIHVDFYNGQGNLADELGGTGLAQANADADATTVAQKIRAFADLTAESELYADGLTTQGVVALGEPYLSEPWMAQHAPYAWSVQGEGTTAAADYARAKLCPPGTSAAYAGGSLKNAPRRFAVITPQDSWYKESAQAAVSNLNAHGCTANLLTYTFDLGNLSRQVETLVETLRAQNTTTVICGCDPILPVYFSGYAAADSYFPEFIVGGTDETDQDVVGQIWDQPFAAHVLGVSPTAPAVPSEQHTWL